MNDLGNHRIMAENIRRYMARYGMTTADLSRKMGLAYTTVSGWVNGTSYPRIDKIEMLAGLFGIEKKDLVESQEVLENVEFIPESAEVPIKVYGSVPAGIPVEAIESTEGTAYIPKKWLSGGREYIGLKVKGSSMYPKYLEDDTVVIQLQKDCRSGQDAVVYVNGYEATLKTVIKESNGKVTLKPINPEYQPHTYGPDDDPIEILGVVKRLIRNI